MAGKKRRKRKGTRRHPASQQQAPSQPGAPLPEFDRRSMDKAMADVTRLLAEQDFDSIDEANAFLQEIMLDGEFPSFEPSTPLEEAQELMYEAFEARGRQRVELARRALEISPDCADAYVLLAEETATTPQQALKFYEQGVAAGERALGETFFAENAGHFWGLVETRPYMRARLGLAHILWELGRQDEAIQHAQEMLRLNPGDNQGVRYLLMLWLLETERNEELAALFDEFGEEPTADGTYPRVLFAFRQEGDSPRARDELKNALRWNPHVPDYLLGRKRPPRRVTGYVTVGGEDEAAAHASVSLSLWRKTPGALEWLARMIEDGID